MESVPDPGEPRPAQAVPAATDDWHWPDYVGLFFNGLATIAAVVGVVFLVLQWKQTDEALAVSKRANELTAAAMKRAADDGEAQDARAEKQLAIARQNADATLAAVETARQANLNSVTAARSELRPWLVLKSVEVQEITRAQSMIPIELLIANVGRSPALAVDFGTFVTGIGLMTAQGRPPLGPTAPTIRAVLDDNGKAHPILPVYVGSDVLAPAEARAATLSVQSSASRFDALLQGASLVYINGKVNYRDTFGTRYSTEVCLVSKVVNVSDGRISKVSFLPYGECNRAP